MDYLTQGKNQTIYDFMTMHPCVALATYSSLLEINLAHVFTYVDDRLNLYFVSRPEHRKVKNLDENDSVSCLFYDDTRIAQVEYIGSAEKVADTDELVNILSKLQLVISNHKTGYWSPPVSQLEGDGYVIVKVVPKSITYRKYESSGTGSEKDEITAQLENEISN